MKTIHIKLRHDEKCCYFTKDWFKITKNVYMSSLKEVSGHSEGDLQLESL